MNGGLAISGLSVSLGRRCVLAQVSLAVPEGTFLGLIGPNGAGKSTLLRAVTGLIPADGEVTVAGQPLADMHPVARARTLSYLPQEREIAWPMTVERVVALGRSPHRRGFARPSAADRDAVERAIETMDLAGLRERSALQLSGGERARVLIARALAQETPLVLADEPTAGLDPAHQIALMQTFRAIARAGRTVVASLHELTLAGQWCDRLALLGHGRVVAEGTPADVLSEDNLSEIYRIRAARVDTPEGPAIVPTGLVGG